MSRSSRITAACVLFVVALVVCLLGAAQVARSGSGLTAHIFLPRTQLTKITTSRPLGPATTDDLQPGLLVRLWEYGWRGKDGYRPLVNRREFFGVTQIGRTRRSPLVSQWRGYLKIDEPGVYRIRLLAPDEIQFEPVTETCENRRTSFAVDSYTFEPVTWSRVEN